MYDLPQAEAPKAKCAACAAPATADWWDTHLCDRHIAQFHDEAPLLEPLELDHAAAHPEDVEQRGTFQFHDAARTDTRGWVILKPGVTAQVARRAAMAWLEAQRIGARRSA